MKYKKVEQKPYCCVGACLEMILNRNKIGNHGQVDIACQLGLIVPENYKALYPNARIGDKPSAGYGTQIQKEEYSINHYLKKNNISLIEEYYYITNLEEARKFLLENKENDIMICVHCKTLYNSLDADWGHMVLLENIKDDEITILDPSHTRNYETVSLETLLKSIVVHGMENGAGFYLIKRIM